MIGNQSIVVYGNLEFKMIVAFLGINKSGNAYISIAGSPNERVALILKVTQPVFSLCGRKKIYLDV